jgi:hypothetical protein
MVERCPWVALVGEAEEPAVTLVRVAGLLAVLALVFGYQARRETLTRPDVYSDDLGRAGRILGWIGWR